MPKPTVSAGYAKALFDLAVAHGADAGVLMRRVGLPDDAFADPDARLSVDRFKRLMREGKALSGKPALALHFGASISFEELTIVGLICHAAETMVEAFEQMNRYGRLVIEVEGVSDGERFKIVRRGDEIWIEDTRSNPDEFPELTESTLGRFIVTTNRIFSDPPMYEAAEVTYPAPAHADAYEELLGVPVTFGASRNAMRVHEIFLTQRIAPRRKYVFAPLTKQADSLMAELETASTVKGKVEAVVLPLLHTSDVGMAQVAREMGMSRQTLYRQLKAEGETYEKLLDDLRHRMSIQYLDGQKVSVNETAYLVGFSDPSSFSRAFKRWTGRSPGQTRRVQAA